MNNFKEFFQKFSLLTNAIVPNCKRVGISPESAVFLVALSNEVDLSHFIKDEFKSQLLKAGFLEEKNSLLKITGKGSIFAKSLEPIFKKTIGF